MRPASQVVLVGLGSADWRLLQPFIDAGLMPQLAAWLPGAAQGSLRTLQPQFPPLLWGSMDSGLLAPDHGLLSHWHVRQAQVEPLNAGARSSPSLWDSVAAHGGRSLLVNWPMTYPAPAVEGECISDQFFHLSGEDELAPAAPGSVHPGSLAADIDDLRFFPGEFDREEIRFFVPEIEAAITEGDPLLARLGIALARAVSVQAVLLDRLAQGDWDLTLVRYSLFEDLGPQALAVMPPRLPFVSPERCQRYGQLLGSVCQYLDSLLGSLFEHMPEQANVLLASERGVASGDTRPEDGKSLQQTASLSWFREHGLIALQGPGIQAGAQAHGATLLDVAPTVLQLLGLPCPGQAPGRALREVLVQPDEGGADAPSIPAPLELTAREATALDQEQSAAQAALLAFWCPDGEATAPGVEAAQAQADFNRAMVWLDARKPRLAEPLLSRLYEASGNDRYAVHLARCLRLLGELDRARDLLEGLVSSKQARPNEQMQLAQVYLQQGEADKALMTLFMAEQTAGAQSSVHAAIGDVYISMQRWEDAERGYNKALERNPGDAAAMRGLAACRLGQGRWKDAIALALDAIDLDRNRPQAHYFLGVALARDRQWPLAAEVFTTCLRLNESHRGAHLELADCLQVLGRDKEAESHRQRARTLASLPGIRAQLSDFRGEGA